MSVSWPQILAEFTVAVIFQSTDNQFFFIIIVCNLGSEAEKLLTASLLMIVTERDKFYAATFCRNCIHLLSCHNKAQQAKSKFTCPFPGE